MAKEFLLKFGTGALTATSGLAPTFTHFVRLDNGTTLAGPGITQIIPGIGMYKFSYTPSFPIGFEVDGATTGLGADRYIHGMLDKLDQVDDLMTANQATLLALGQSNSTNVTSIVAAIGTTASSFGGTAVDPATLYGYLKRLQEFMEGNSTYTKNTGLWDIYSRGSSTQLIQKTLNEDSNSVTKT